MLFNSVSILFADDRFLVVDKPAGLLTIPGRDLSEPSLIERLRQTHPDLLVVHRIDRETSGCVLFAKNAESHRLANGWFEKHEVKKEYLALIEGSFAQPVLRLDRPIDGQKALSQATMVEEFETASLVRVRIQTGRRHQIRIHLSQAGHPILGDTLYRGKTMGRVALHAEKLELPTGEKILAPIPEDFQSWLFHLRTGK